MRSRPLLLALALSSCLIPARDRGGPAGVDCVPSTEVCDGVDNDCDGLIDERLGQAWYADEDSDGYGGAATWACEAPEGAVEQGGDCDDGDPTSYPGAPETCDGVDHDCDGQGTPFGGPWYPDLDGDGFGDPGRASTECARPPGWITDGTDCDDGDDTVFPGATELCDGVDRDCDGTPSALGGPWYEDADEDTFGTPLSVRTDCTAPTGFVANDDDCDDTDPAIQPGAVELCNRIDDNCDPGDDLLDGDDATCAVVDCADLQVQRPVAPDGVYWIDPAGSGPFQAACDMTRQGGGWTLVYAYTFVDYGSFNTAANAVTPIPSWTVAAAGVPVSTTPPMSETDFAAIDHALWASIGNELFSVSTIQDWIVCSAGTGDITGPTAGTLSCTNVAEVASACAGQAPSSLNYFTYGWALYGPNIYTYWEGSLTVHWPTHDPCGLNQPNQLAGSLDPRGALYLR